ncbi:MAG: GNAT family N-acetyltransferase [Hyphomicrobiales bacterium]
MIAIRRADGDAVERVVESIRRYWKQGHIFVRDRAFFTYEMQGFGELQFLLAEEEGHIAGLVGYIPYDPALENADVFLVLLRVRDEYAKSGLGMKLLKACKALSPTAATHTVGVRPEVIALYALMGFKTGTMDHLYWIDTSLSSHHLVEAHCAPGDFEPATPPPSFAIRMDAPTHSLFERCAQNYRPYKSHAYFEKRYLRHPIHDYRFITTFDADGQAIAVLREVVHQGAKALRIIDMIGEAHYLSALCRASFAKAKDIGAEYVDLYCAGPSPALFVRAGMRLNDGRDIVPNYFAPFTKDNIALTFATTAQENFRLFRGDGDQDRPA